MFQNQTFYHGHLRKLTIAFGSLFTNLWIERKNEDETVAKSLKVPLTFSPKDHMLARILDAPSFEEGRAPFEITLPRMAFDMSQIRYDGDRNLAQITPVRSRPMNGQTQQTFFSVPYTLTFDLSIFTKSIEDNYQILEQILPYFKPDFSVTINELPDLGVQRDIQFTLNGVRVNNQYELTMKEGGRRMIVSDLSFDARMNFFGFVGRSSEIRTVIQNIFASPTGGEGTRITTEATEDATPEDIRFTQTIEELFAE
jgi:hypothetical protein